MRPSQQTRLIVTALIEGKEQLLLTQLAHGRFAGFWLLPSATVDVGTVDEAAKRMVAERTGYPVLEQQLISVIEEAKLDLLTLRFLFKTRVGERESIISNAEISQARWFSRIAVQEVLAERDVVPNLGVMSIIRAWADRLPFRPLEALSQDGLCPCGSGDRFIGCCGWENR